MSDELSDEPRRDLRSIIFNTLASTPMLTVTAYDTSPVDTSLTIDDIRYDICLLKEDGAEVRIDAAAGAARDIRDALTFLLRLDGLITVEDQAETDRPNMPTRPHVSSDVRRMTRQTRSASGRNT